MVDTIEQSQVSVGKGSRKARPPVEQLTSENSLLAKVTFEYLDSVISARNVLKPSAIESELIARTNCAFSTENKMARSREDRISLIKTLRPWQVAQVMLRLHHVVRVTPEGDGGSPDLDLLAMYCEAGRDAGLYLTDSDSLRTRARCYNTQLTTHEFKEVAAVLYEDAPRRHLTRDRDLVPVENGIWHHRDKELLPFSSDLIFLSKLRNPYNSDADESPVFTHPTDGDWELKSWLRDVMDDDELVDLMWELLSAVARPHVSWNKTAWFYSESGNNGKGTLCELMRNLVGRGSCVSLPLSEMGNDFALEPLLRASAIITDENDVGTFIDKAANLKAIVTNDPLSINRKYQRPVSFQFHGFMVQCLNEFPKVKDKSESFYRRQLFVPFTKSFTGHEKKYIKDDFLKRPELLEYVLHEVLHAAPFYTLSEPTACKEVLAEYKEWNDPVRSFWVEFRQRLRWDLVPFTFLYDIFKTWFAATVPRGLVISSEEFANRLVALVTTDPGWSCPDKRKKVRPGKSMATPEPLIAEYDLKNWMNPHYRGKDPDKLCVPILKASYRGIQRVTAVAAQSNGTDAA